MIIRPGNISLQASQYFRIDGNIALMLPILSAMAYLHTGDIARAAIATIRGDHEVAIEWLNSAWNKNWRRLWRWTLISDSIFSQLKNSPSYTELVARFETDMDQQRELAYELLGIKK